MFKISFIIPIFCLATTLPIGVSAHSGGLNAQGCHAGSKPYHCHRNGSTQRRTTSRSLRGGDKDCADFSSWRQAQNFFLSAGRGDPHRLDADRDGIACEHLR